MTYMHSNDDLQQILTALALAGAAHGPEYRQALLDLALALSIPEFTPFCARCRHIPHDGTDFVTVQGVNTHTRCLE